MTSIYIRICNKSAIIAYFGDKYFCAKLFQWSFGAIFWYDCKQQLASIRNSGLEMKLILLLATLIFGVSGASYEALVPARLQPCCSDVIPDREECKKVDAAVTTSGHRIYLFSGDTYVLTKIRNPSPFPEILVDQSVKPIKHWDFKEDPDRMKSTEIDAAISDHKKIIIKKGDHVFT